MNYYTNSDGDTETYFDDLYASIFGITGSN